MRGSLPRCSLIVVQVLLLACSGDQKAGDGQAQASGGAISIDGSSTVYPISEAVAEEFMAANEGKTRVTVGLSGTGGGFKRFCAGETDISDASRPIKDSEKEACVAKNIAFTEIEIGYDGLTIVVNPKNTFVQCLKVDELKKIWGTDSKINNWSQVRAGFPNESIKLYGPGTSSGTFDYFTEVINGKQGASRADYTASEDDNVLVQGVEGDANALGYFGYAYYKENAAKLKEVGVDAGSGCILPTEETIKNGSYKPLSRPLYIYVNNAGLQRPEVKAFVEYYLSNASKLVPQVGYVALEAAKYEQQKPK
ncbi:MAG TPA: PstS family phosphate ABC transporter substrate-binding protein [Longimicrobiales bacterium]|nr:PstS family phosphate ABC transporter substrate-binding protein [Longimicrobiales bacterium]